MSFVIKEEEVRAIRQNTKLISPKLLVEGSIP
jgi:hypothetical protein